MTEEELKKRKLEYEYFAYATRYPTKHVKIKLFFPNKFEPGYVAYNNQVVVGVQTRWEAVIFQPIPTPS